MLAQAPAASAAVPAARAGSKPSAKAQAGAPAAGDELGRLKRLGFTSLAECLLSVPKEYVDCTRPLTRVLPANIGQQQYLILSVQDIKLFDKSGASTRNWRQVFRATMGTSDETGQRVEVTFFGNCWPCKEVERGDLVHVHGTLVFGYGRLSLDRPSFVEPQSRGVITALYRGKPGQVSGESLALGVSRALHRIEDAECLLLAQAGLRESEFLSRTGVTGQEFLRRLHQPTSLKEGEAACDLARELSVEAIIRKAAAAKTRPPVATSAIPISRDFVQTLISELPFPLTADQVTAINEIVSDLRSAFPMRRLLSGDVGTGKSITFMVPAAAAYDAGAEVAILAPSQLVVSQLARELREMFPGLPVCEVMAGGKIGDGICVGTTALLKAAAKAKRTFDIVITDEQHKFGVDQKLALVAKRTNVLEATATAIPRTLAMVHFGGMDFSVLRTCPVAKRIQTRITKDDDIDRVDAFIHKVIAQKGQVAVIYPRVADEAETPDEGPGMVSVIEAGEAWSQAFPGRVGVLHGKLSTEEKAQVIQGMHAGQFDILVSSLVIEVGVTLPSLKVMLVNNPERFGVSQLHQLRGRVARKGGSGYMFLHASGPLQDDAMERMRLLCECADGFELAERDMDSRGFGDVEDDSESQTGSTRTLFWGARITHQELHAKALGQNELQIPASAVVPPNDQKTPARTMRTNTLAR
ncbi:hypothetical protein CBP36_19595 (plasmid) [Acidovorax carolinensis]|uniref:ATP-dependent DNA helicase RecG n=2 Tax=Acidovorax carolinensis TaxID=553814 RepID=A0A240UJL3_9BURK|nr:hypothetical protein CBP35_19550 [Acidovorax carolinensis]ART61305.1 hypothetical protein CBP36_19595 [Acidovorax carolinensis]